jgi:hypothetical protein
MTTRQRKPPHKPKRRTDRRVRPSDRHLTTPEGDPVVSATATYRHDALDEILARLRQTDDFDLDKSPEPGSEGVHHGAWLQMAPGPPPLHQPLGVRVLAVLMLTPTTLIVDAMSRRRRQACRRRLEHLLGDRIHLEGLETKSMEEALRELPPGPEPEPVELPPELIAELEERFISQWLEESIPALGGLTPREAAKTPEGRRRLDALFDYIAREQAGGLPPGAFSPDYRKAKKILGLEEEQ